MSTAVVPYRRGGTGGVQRFTQALSRFWSRLTRAKVTLWGTTGWSIVRGTQPSEFQSTGTEVRRLGWERHPVVNACARAVVELIQSVPLEVYRKAADGTATVISRHPALDLLAAPRVGLSRDRLVGRTAMHLFLYGNAFWVLERRGMRGVPRGIRPVPPEDVQFVWLNEETDTITAYDWRDLQGRTHAREPVENVVHFRDLDAADGLFGYPRLASALLDISADNEASQYVRQVVLNHGMPGAIVMTEGDADLTDLKAAEEKFREKYTVRGMRGMTAFVAGVKDVKPIGFNLQQLEFPDLRRVTREDICAAAGIDPRMIGVASAASDGGLSGVQFREARHRLIQQTVYPLMRAIECELNYWFMPEFGEPLVRFSEEYIAAITEDVTATSARVVGEVREKVRTVEEAREAVGLPAQMDPTHTYPGGVTVGDAAATATELQQASVAALKAKPAEDDGASNRAPSQNGTRPAPATRALTLLRADTSEDATARWEREYERAALSLFAREREELMRFFAALAAGSALLADDLARAVVQRVTLDYAPPVGRYARAWLERYHDLIARTVQIGGRDLAAASGLSFTMENPRVRGMVERRAGDLVQNVTETTRDAIRAAVVTARGQHLSVQQTARLISDTTFGAITRARAQTIARTEVVGALVAGEFAAAVQSGVMRSKTWLTQQDERVRDTHAALDNMTIDIGAAFPNGLRYPHDPLGAAAEIVNCRCSLKYSDLEAGARA